MSYTPTVWTDATALTTTNLDHLESQYSAASTDFAAHNHDTLYYTKTQMESTFWYSGNDGAGSGCDADLMYKSTGNIHYSDLATLGATTGVIAMWEGAVGTVPSGWHVCDGTSGTIDLRDQWVIGAGSTYAVGASGGSATRSDSDTITVASHVLTTSECPEHSHTLTDYYADTIKHTEVLYYGQYIYKQATLTGTLATTGGGLGHGHTSSACVKSSVENKPPSVALYYIQKT